MNTVPSIMAHIPVIIELQKQLSEAMESMKSCINDLPEGEIRAILSWQREEAALAVNKSKSYIAQLKATADRNLKTTQET